jgi:glutamate/tyrosine decarboxylase-like PLP-dependent enzyme
VGRITVDAVREHIATEHAPGYLPFGVVGAAGTVATGAVDPLMDLAALYRDQGLWFYVDGAYGGFAAGLVGTERGARVPDDLRGIGLADSVAIDPHNWLYSPLAAGSVLVRRPVDLLATFSSHPTYYHLGRGAEDELPLNYFEYGPQNSRGFRALKVWLGLQQTVRSGVTRQIADDIALAETMARRIEDIPELQVFTRQLRITTSRYVPADLGPGSVTVDEYLDRLNMTLQERPQLGGEVFISNAVLNGRFFLCACIVNFRTTAVDVEASAEIVVRNGRIVDAELRSKHV